MQRVQKLQNFAARVADGSARKFDFITPIIKELKWLKVHNQYNYHLCCLVWKIINSNYPDWFITLPTVSEVTVARTRQANNLHIPRTNINAGSKSIEVRGPKVWNDLPRELRNIASVSGFKAKLKDHFLTCDK